MCLLEDPFLTCHLGTITRIYIVHDIIIYSLHCFFPTLLRPCLLMFFGKVRYEPQKHLDAAFDVEVLLFHLFYDVGVSPCGGPVKFVSLCYGENPCHLLCRAQTVSMISGRAVGFFLQVIDVHQRVFFPWA